MDSNTNTLIDPRYIIRLSGEQFESDLSCLGEQLARLLNCIEQETKQLSWYAFDVFGSTHQSLDILFPRPYCKIGNTVDLVNKVKRVVQFHSGVFIGAHRETKIDWDVDNLPETEEGEGLQHPSAVIEIRSFDCSYFEIYGIDNRMERKITSCCEK
ncbi:hypothetical protein [Paenibacillus popilliae]|uniref:hypothetical protein n=1 Tax=Paenibacillus popilliae TaxID=78057 RepID=UPI0005A7C405|nr:hypothetical protein [Paenibacillus popilliae]